MELSLFQDENTLAFTKVRKDKLASAIKLYNMTCSYFIATDPNAFRKLKTFNEDFAYLCEDLFTQIEISTLKKDQKNLISDTSYSGDFFQDPKKDYYEILIEYLKKGNANQKALGAFYTPQDVVETLTSTIIRKNNYKTSDLNKLKVLDPTMGGCDWLTCWFEQVLKKNLNNRKSIDDDFKEQVFSHTIHGVDIDPVAVLCSRLIFWHYFDYKSSTKKTLKKNLVLGNTLDIFNNSQKKVPGFDIIIGNPPYVVQNLKSLNCQTNDSSNLFAAITEASTELLSDGGTICFVVPLNITCAKSFSSLREYMDEKYQEITFSTYGIRPQKMFDGVDQRITVFFAKKKTLKNKSQTTIYTSHNGHFQWRKREELVQALQHKDAGCKLDAFDVVEFGWPKFSQPSESKILYKIRPSKNEISFYDLLSKTKTPYPVFYYGNARYFIKALDYVPYYKNSKAPDKENSELKVVYAKNENDQKLLIALLNSTFFYWAWVSFSDCFHMDIKILKHFSVKKMNSLKLQNLANKVIHALKKSSFKKKHGDNFITEFNVRACLNEIKSIDDFLCNYYSLNNSESEFIKNYASDLRKSKEEASLTHTNEEAA